MPFLTLSSHSFSFPHNPSSPFVFKSKSPHIVVRSFFIPTKLMAPETTTSHDGGEKPKNLAQEIKELISALTSLHRHPGTTGAHGPDEDEEQGVWIITLSGCNVGATMRGVAEMKPAEEQELEEVTTYVNSNFQDINNSIMVGGSYRTNDSGVHLDISDYIDHNQEEHKKGKRERGGKHDDHDQEEQGKSGSDEEER